MGERAENRRKGAGKGLGNRKAQAAALSTDTVKYKNLSSFTMDMSIPVYGLNMCLVYAVLYCTV